VLLHHAIIIEIEGESYRKKAEHKKVTHFSTETGQGNCRHPDRIVEVGQPMGVFIAIP
jgi:hypothetical protein